MAYRDPSADVEFETDFTAQFEWDGERWLFRRARRAAPVEVTREELLRSTTIYENGMLAIIAVAMAVGLFGLTIFGTSYNPFTRISELQQLLPLLAFVVLIVAGIKTVNFIATKEFSGRPPQGPARSRMGVQREYVRKARWLDFALPMIFAGCMSWLHWPAVTLVDWFWLALAACLTGYVLFNLGLKLSEQRS